MPAVNVRSVADIPKGAGIDLTDLDLFANGFPHDVFAELRHAAPVMWHEPTIHTPDAEGFWTGPFDMKG